MVTPLTKNEREHLATYYAEKDRGLVHTAGWEAYMQGMQAASNAMYGRRVCLDVDPDLCAGHIKGTEAFVGCMRPATVIKGGNLYCDECAESVEAISVTHRWCKHHKAWHPKDGECVEMWKAFDEGTGIEPTDGNVDAQGESYHDTSTRQAAKS